MAKSELGVHLYGQKIGVLTCSGTQVQGFKYVRGYHGAMLSHSMPPQLRTASRLTASAWFENLLPEGHSLRSAMASAHDSRDTSTPGLLARAGLDCAGAVQVTADDEIPDRTGRAMPVSDEEIGDRLIAATSGQPVSEDAERWSVAGQQGKLALHRTQAGEWMRAENGLPTTHLLKPGITRFGDQGLIDQAFIEHITLDAARLLDLQVAKSEFSYFNDVPAIVSERYDRYWENGVCRRIHQEDICQALGVPAGKKYEVDGGPGVAVIADLLERSAPNADAAAQSRFTFTQMVIFNYLSGSPDAHGKNYSILITDQGDTYLAPMYDTASGLAFSKRNGTPHFPRAAMKVGSRDRFGNCTGDDWVKFAGAVKFHPELIRIVRDDMADRIVDAFRTAIDRTPAQEATKRRVLRSPMLQRMDENCRQ